MADVIKSGTEVSAGVYRCENCGDEEHVEIRGRLHACPACGHGEYVQVGGADSAETINPDGSDKATTHDTLN